MERGVLAMKKLSFLLAIVTLVVTSSVVFGATDYHEGWNKGSLAGWFANTTMTTVEVRDAGGNPAGYLFSYGEDFAGATTNLDEVSGDYTAGGIYKVSFDLWFISGDVNGAWFRVRYKDDTYNGWRYPLAEPSTSGWNTYAIEFDPTWSDTEAMDAGWVPDEDPIVDFSTTMSDVYHPEIRLEDGTIEAGIDNFSLFAQEEEHEIHLDIRPTSCPNPFNPKSQGVLPVAILGTSDFDVSNIDPSTILLEGVPALRWNIEDVAAPAENGDGCECTSEGPDGYDDLTLKFKTPEIVDSLGGPLTRNDELTLTITGTLFDETSFEANDCVVIRGNQEDKGRRRKRPEHPLTLLITSSPSDPVQLISYELPEQANVEVTVYDVAGRVVRRFARSVEPAGVHTMKWDTTRFTSGIYFFNVRAGMLSGTRKVVIVK